MPNGKPGDGPVVDIVVYGVTVFGPEVDALVREIDQYTDNYATFDPFEKVQDELWAVWRDRELWLARDGRSKPAGRETEELHAALLALRDRLRSERS